MFKLCAYPTCTKYVCPLGLDRCTELIKYRHPKHGHISTISHSFKWSKFCYYHHKQRWLEQQSTQIAQKQRVKRKIDGIKYGGQVYDVKFTD